jgi:hypothetical protein
MTKFTKHWLLLFLICLGPVSPTAVKVNCRLKCFVTVVTYCYNNVFVYFNLQLTLTAVGETGPYGRIHQRQLTLTVG